MDSNGDSHHHVIYHKQVWKFQPGQETFLNAETCCLSLHIFHEKLNLTMFGVHFECFPQLELEKNTSEICGS